MLIEINGFWINPSHIVRLGKDTNGIVIIVMSDGKSLDANSSSSEDVAGLIIRSCVDRKR